MRLFLSLLLFLVCLGCGPAGSPSYQGKPLSDWEAQAQSEDPAKRYDASKALGEMGPEGLPALTKLLRDSQSRVRALATLSVVRMGSQAVPRLIDLLRDPDENVRAGAAIALRHIGPPAEAAIPALTDLLQDPDEGVRDSAAKALRVLEIKRGRPGKPAA
jgi:HEAT repeat protein